MITINNKQLGFTCCFCGEGIKSTDIDPCRVNVMGNYENSTKDSSSQDFYSHFDCFKGLMHESTSGYFLETNFLDDEKREKQFMLNDKFIDPKELFTELKRIEHETFNINRRIELLFQQLKYIFCRIKNCENNEDAFEYFKLLDAIQGCLALIAFRDGISLPHRLTQFVYDFDNFEGVADYYFPKIRSGEYTL